ncbi:hypothetical protein WJX84_008910 [Apatococcus fuscideae]|uniref:Uncharacterized protein n=1 Tax=Apatococcus fuscideae TaxID=2026836 RepID=A0AAW1SVR8_9CHLO
MVRCNSPIPFGSPWREADARHQQNHRLVDAVVNTVPRIDNRTPPEQEHLTHGRKLSAVERGRQLNINKENMVISQRLQKIYKSRSSPKSAEPIKPGIVLDQQLRPVIDNQEPQHMPPGGSLNSVSRRREMQRIMSDNQAILRRICCSRGAISAEKLRREGEQQQKWATMRSKFVPQSELLGGGKRSDRPWVFAEDIQQALAHAAARFQIREDQRVAAPKHMAGGMG